MGGKGSGRWTYGWGRLVRKVTVDLDKEHSDAFDKYRRGDGSTSVENESEAGRTLIRAGLIQLGIIRIPPPPDREHQP